jgi:hypothetical protein
MATDRNGNALIVGDDVVVVGTARDIVADEVLLILGDGQSAVRCIASDTLKADLTGGGGGNTYFPSGW